VRIGNVTAPRVVPIRATASIEIKIPKRI